MNMKAIRNLKMPGVHEAICAAPNQWPEYGLTIYGGSKDVGITCQSEYDDIRNAQFTSWTFTKFHYCPTAKWDDWVALAKRILEVDAKCQ
jgi:hypothetical protein